MNNSTDSMKKEIFFYFFLFLYRLHHAQMISLYVHSTALNCCWSWVAIVWFSHGNVWWWCRWRRYSRVDAFLYFYYFLTVLFGIKQQLNDTSNINFMLLRRSLLLWISLYFSFHSHAYHLLLLFVFAFKWNIRTPHIYVYHIMRANHLRPQRISIIVCTHTSILKAN